MCSDSRHSQRSARDQAATRFIYSGVKQCMKLHAGHSPNLLCIEHSKLAESRCKLPMRCELIRALGQNGPYDTNNRMLTSSPELLLSAVPIRRKRVRRLRSGGITAIGYQLWAQVNWHLTVLRVRPLGTLLHSGVNPSAGIKLRYEYSDRLREHLEAGRLVQAIHAFRGPST